MGIPVDWSPNLPCPNKCKPWDDKGTFCSQSVIWYTKKSKGAASVECVLCKCPFVFYFNPDVPFKHQPIKFKANPKVQTLNGLVSEVPKKKRKGNASPTDNNG